jgi:hypothetical protein
MRAIDIGNGQTIAFADFGRSYPVKGTSYGETNTIVSTKAVITMPDKYSIEGGYYIVPDGLDNKFGYQLMQLLEDNNLGLGIIRRQRGLQYGQGLGLYTLAFAEGRRDVQWMWDDKIGKWLEGWDYEEYLLNILLDLLIKQEYYTKLVRTREGRINAGSGSIAALEHVAVADCRRQWPDDKGKVANIFVADWRELAPQKIARFPVFDPIKGMTGQAYMIWTRFYQYGRGNIDELVPGFFGSRKWMQRSNVAPDILKAQTDNGLHIKWHIISPQSYWDTKREVLMQNCKQKGEEYKEEMLETLKDEILTGLARVLSGVENVGKFFHSEAVRQELGIGKSETLKWEIVPIDMKVKEFTDSQINISDKADSAITSSMGLHPSLSNIIINGKLASGSEMLYAYKLFLATETKIVEKKALEVMNMVKQLFFPNIPGKFGFYHDIVKREEDISPGERTTNNDN